MTTTIALVTGATRGLGLETTRQLAAQGWTVLLGARDLEHGEKVAAEFAADVEGAGEVHPVQLDVTSDESVTAAADRVRREFGRLDVLVNNAGITGGYVTAADTTPADFLPVFGVNLLGPVRVTHAFLPLLEASDAPRIVMVSSGMGSIGVTSDPARLESTLIGLTYTSSKTALNMVTSQYAKGLGPKYRVNAVDPGYTATDLNHHQGIQTIEEGVEAIVRYAQTPPDGPTGGFFDRHGPVPW